MSGGPLLVVDDLMLRFGGITALDGVSFELRAGELLALIGPNGAGRTSILNCLNGVYRPQRGSIVCRAASSSAWRRPRSPRSVWPARSRTSGCSRA